MFLTLRFELFLPALVDRCFLTAALVTTNNPSEDYADEQRAANKPM